MKIGGFNGENQSSQSTWGVTATKKQYSVFLHKISFDGVTSKPTDSLYSKRFLVCWDIYPPKLVSLVSSPLNYLPDCHLCVASLCHRRNLSRMKRELDKRWLRSFAGHLRGSFGCSRVSSPPPVIRLNNTDDKAWGAASFPHLIAVANRHGCPH